MNELISQYPQEIARILSRYPAEGIRSALMPLLYLAQQEQGYITPPQMEEIARLVETSPTEVASVVGFYSLFHDQPGGKYRVQVCTDLPCALRGADQFLEQLCQNLALRVGETSEDGLITIEEVKCLAGCNRAPVLQVQAGAEITYHEQQTVESAVELVASLKRDEGSK